MNMPAAEQNPELRVVEPERMWAAAAWRDPLQRAGLNAFDDVMQTAAGRCLRALADRENWRLELHAPHGGVRGAYLKKHHVRSWRHRLAARLGRTVNNSPGRVEAENIDRLRQGGLAAMPLIAFGERLHSDGLLESFVLTEELTGFTQLDDFLIEAFPSIAAGVAGPRDSRLPSLIDAVAAVAARFHALGFNHRDLYCCHFFIREVETGRFDVNLIDLQRVQRRRWLRRRWIVKDLAQLAYSTPRDRVSCTDMLRFIRAYLGVHKLRAADKRLIRSVMFKCGLMHRKQGPYR